MNIPVNRIEVGKKPGFSDPAGEKTRQTLLDAGVKDVREVKIIQVWLIYGGMLFWRDLEMLATELFADPVIEEFRINRSLARQSKNQKIVGVAYKPGVTYSSEETAKEAIRDLGVQWILGIKNGQKYVIRGLINDTELKTIHKELINPVIQYMVEDWDKETVILT